MRCRPLEVCSARPAIEFQPVAASSPMSHTSISAESGRVSHSRAIDNASRAEHRGRRWLTLVGGQSRPSGAESLCSVPGPVQQEQSRSTQVSRQATQSVSATPECRSSHDYPSQEGEGRKNKAEGLHKSLLIVCSHEPLCSTPPDPAIHSDDL